MSDTITINRAPVLTLWAAVVAERLGYDRDEALTLGKCVAGLNAQSKGRMLGIYGPPKDRGGGGAVRKAGLGEEFWIDLCDRAVPCVRTDEGIRAVVKDRPIDPAAVEKYLRGRFGEDFDRVRETMAALAESRRPEDLAAEAYSLYEQFRPAIPRGVRGWGARGELDLARVRSLASGGR